METKKKMGRPTNNPRTKNLNIRISEKELEMLRECSEFLEITRANVLMMGLEKVYKKIKNKK